MGEKDKGYKAEIPTDALAEALESIEKYNRSKAEGQDGADSDDLDGTVVRVEVETEDEGLDREAHAQLLADLEKARREAAEAQEKMLRVAADADNVRKRAIKERQEAIKFGQEGLLRELLIVIDNMERTLEHVPADDANPKLTALREGVEMTRRLMINVLENYNVKGFESLGQPFDPMRHEALSRQETTEAEAGTILTEMHRGYMLHERLIRPALVVVACAPESAACREDGTAEQDENQGSASGTVEPEGPSQPGSEDGEGSKD